MILSMFFFSIFGVSEQTTQADLPYRPMSEIVKIIEESPVIYNMTSMENLDDRPDNLLDIIY